MQIKENKDQLVRIINVHIKIYSSVLLPLLIFPFFENANAQSQCPPGYMRIATGEGPASPCVPDPNYMQQQPQVAPKVQWENRWGAIAQNEKSGPGIVGFSSDQTSKRKAKKAAIKDCESRGGRNCTADFTYKNQCASIVSGEKSFYLSSAGSIKRSVEIGNNNCLKYGSTKCKVEYTNCTDAVRIQ